MINALVFSFLNVLVYTQTTLPQLFTSPFLNLSTVTNITQNINPINLMDTSYLSMETTDYYVSRLSTNGKLQIFDINTNTLNFTIFRLNASIVSYDLLDNESLNLTILLDNNIGYLYNLFSNGTSQQIYQTDNPTIATNPRYAVQIFKDELILSVRNPIPTTIPRRLKSNINYNSTFRFTTLFNTPSYNLKICYTEQSNTFYRIAVWKRNCYVLVLNCPLNAICTQQYIFNNTACDYNTQYNSEIRDYYKLTWSSNCSKILFESKNQGIKLVKFTTSTTLATFNVFNLTSSLSGFWFLDDFDQFIGVLKPDGNFLIYNVSSQGIIDSKLLPASTVAAFSRSKKSLFLSLGQQLLTYNFGCLYPNYTFLTNGLCSFNSSYQPPTTNQLPTNQSSLDPTANNRSTTDQPAINQSTTNSVDNNTYLNQIRLQQQETTPLDREMNIIMTEVLDTITQPLEYTATAMMFLPFSFLYMRFINFWAICSMFKIAQIKFPKLLMDHLTAIYEMVNSSMFENFGWEIDFGTNSHQKFQDFQIGHGFSSNLIKTNMENFIMTFFSYLILGLMYFLQSGLSQNNFIKNKLSRVNYRLAFAGQFIGIMNSFIFNLPVILKRSEQDVFDQKINMVLQNLFFILSVFVSCLTIIIVNENVQHQNDETGIKVQELNWFFDCQCNCLLPIALMFDYIPLFLAVNSVFFCIPIYTASKKKKCRALFLIKSLYLQFFNTGVIFIVLFESNVIDLSYEYLQIKGIVTLFTTFIMGIGAVHEALQLIFKFVYEIFKLICFINYKITNVDSEQKLKFDNEPQVAFNNSVSPNTISPIKSKISLVGTNNISTKYDTDSGIQTNTRIQQQQQSDEIFMSKIGKKVKIVQKNMRSKFRLDKFKKPISGARSQTALNEKLNIMFGSNKKSIKNENNFFQVEEENNSEIEKVDFGIMPDIPIIIRKAKRACRVQVMKRNHWLPSKNQNEQNKLFSGN